MKQFNAFAAKFRINVVLCCSTAFLLTACGGNIEAGNDQLSATAASVSTDAGAAAAAGTSASATAVEAVAEAAPAAGTSATPGASTAVATGETEDASAQAFELTGYDSNPLQAQTEQKDAGANAPASIKQ